MTRLTIRRYPDPALKAAAEPVTDFGPELATLADDLYETMKAAPGVGITAPHCGILKRLTVIDLPELGGSQRLEDMGIPTFCLTQFALSEQ